MTCWQVFEWLMCSNAGLDSHRFMDIIDMAIESEEVVSCKAYISWAAAVASKKRPQDPLQRSSKKQKSSNEDQTLVAAIRYLLVCFPFHACKLVIPPA